MASTFNFFGAFRRRARPEGWKRRRGARTNSACFSAIEKLDSRELLSGTNYVDGRLLVGLTPDADQTKILQAYPGAELTPLGDYGLFVMTLPEGMSTMSAIDGLDTAPGVRFAEPDYYVTKEAVPNDARFGEQWALRNIGQSIRGQGGSAGADIDAVNAWNNGVGSSSVILAIVDDGIDYTHPDLAGNMWVNPGEIAGNGIDDDANGYVDDINGYDFGTNDAIPLPEPGDSHGTHVAGIAGAVGNNNIGISGVNWDVSLMAVKIFSPGGGATISGIVAGLNYAVDMGAFVSNHSYNTGGGGPIQAHQAAIANAQAKGHVFVSSAGNTAQDNDVIDHYPSDYPFDNVVAVAATDNRDVRAVFSNYGATTVHLGAPGVDILSTVPGGYTYQDGTSMASPHVAGAVAYLKSLRPDLGYNDILGAIYRGVDANASLAGITITGGRLNLEKAISELPVLPDPEPGVSIMLGPSGNVNSPVPFFEWSTAANAAYYELEVDDLTANIPGFYKRDVAATSHLADFQFSQHDYQARVRTVTSTGLMGEWSNYVTFTVDVAIPVKPIMSRPLGEIGTSFPVYEWNGQVEASMYTLWVNDQATGKRVIYRTNYSGISYQHFDPLPDGTYRAWVQAYNSLNERSPWSDFVEFTINAPTAGRPAVTGPGVITNDVNPRIEWAYSDEAWKYDLWINYRNTNTKPYLREPAIIGQNYYDTTGLPQGTFDAWVRVINGNGEIGPWSPTHTFTVDVLPPDRPVMTGPVPAAGSLVVNDLTPTITWDPALRAEKYDLWVNNESTGQVQIVRQTTLTDTSYTPPADLPEGNYRAWVRGINSAGEVGNWSAPINFTLDLAIPVAPAFTGPVPNTAGSVETSTPTFTWQGDAVSAWYELWIDDSTTGQVKTIYLPKIVGNSYTVPDSQRLQEHVYKAYVRAFNSAGEASKWSEPFIVRIDVPNPSTPSLISPTGTIRTRTPKFEWQHTAGSVQYEILIRDLERQENIVLQVKSFTLSPDGSIASYTLPADKALRNSTYRVWIRGFNSQGTASAWSASKTFTISVSVDSELMVPKEEASGVQQPEVLLASVRYAESSVSDSHPQIVPRDPGDAAMNHANAADVQRLESDQQVQNGGVSGVSDETDAADLAAVMMQFADPQSDLAALVTSTAASERSVDDSGAGWTGAAAILTVLPVTRQSLRRRSADHN